MALRKVSAATEAELRAILDRQRLAMMEIGGRRVLLQVVEDEFDLDAFLEDHPEALRQIQAGVRAVEAGDIVDHEEVLRASQEPAVIPSIQGGITDGEDRHRNPRSSG